jgi:glycosyltransferase involved in cell wall biosynthesis
VPFIASCPVTMGLQEPAPFAWPQHYEKMDVLYNRVMIPLYCLRAAHLFPMAHWILEENRKHLRLPLRNATVTWPAPHDHLRPIDDRAALEAFRAQYELPQRFLLCVTRVDHPGIEDSTSFYPGKNPQAALRAFLRIRDTIPHHMVFAGRRVRDFFVHEGFTEADLARVHFIHFVPFGELGKLYNLAEVCVMTPFYEGFGFALMGALACGIPTVTAGAGACPEVVADGALLADPYDPADIAAKIRRLIDDPDLRADLRARGLRRMSELTWKRCAQETLAGLARSVRRNGRAPR